MVWLWMAAIPVALGALYVFLTAPGRRARSAHLSRLYAHRGLHGGGTAENSLAAFERACRAGVGIELDVRFTADRAVVVFHDDALERVCGRPERVDALTLARLREIPLPGGERVPTLEEALTCVAGRVPLLIEVKTCRGVGRLCAATWERLAAYRGEYAVESFNPLAMRWFRRHAPEVLRGQLVTIEEEYLDTMRRAGAWALANLMANFLSRPDFVAFDIRMGRRFAIRVQRHLYRARLAVWTVRRQARLKGILRRGESAILETRQGDDPITNLEGNTDDET